MTEDGFGSEGENGSHPPSFHGHAPVPYGIDATVQKV